MKVRYKKGVPIHLGLESEMFSGLSISGVSEVVCALFRGVGVEQLADGGDDSLEGLRRRFAQQMLELAEDLLDRIQIRRVFGEKEQLRSG
jgi:hypothetical protein